MRALSCITAFGAMVLGWSAFAENWPQWRGPNFNGSSNEKNLPSEWTKETALWSTPMPGPSAATPIIWGDKVFISTADPDSGTMHALCLDRKSGKILWDNKVTEGLRHDEKSNFASPSPVADADRVFFFYGNGPLVAFDHDGKELWHRDIAKEFGQFAFQWTFSSSPTLYGGKLYFQDLQRNVPVNGHGRADGPIESFLMAMDPVKGTTLWRTVRPCEAVGESHEAYTTPVPFEYQGRKEILVAGGDCLTGYNPDSGEEMWRWGTWNPRKINHWRLVPSPVTGGGVVLACAPKGDPVYAIKAGGKGKLDDSVVAWKSDQERVVTSDVPTPLFYDGDFFVQSEGRKCISRVDPPTGKIKWTLQLPGTAKFEASPTGGDGKIYVMNFVGEVAVIDAAKGSVIKTIPMGEPDDDMTRSAIAVSDGQLFIRTNHRVFCVGKK